MAMCLAFFDVKGADFAVLQDLRNEAWPVQMLGMHGSLIANFVVDEADLLVCGAK